MFSPECYSLGRDVSAAMDHDIFLLNGDLERPLDFQFLRFVTKYKVKPKALLILVTPGGDADVAYRIARHLQEFYEEFSVFVSGWCKSAGTLCAIGANRIIMSTEGELGPLDVQLGRKDDLIGYGSGLEIEAALGALKGYTFNHFEGTMLEIISKSDGRVSVNTAAQIAANLTVGLFADIYSQIDPAKVGEIARSMMIARDYGARLASHSDNLKGGEDSLSLLVSSYCSHSFVIDFREARKIFNSLERPDDKLSALQMALGRCALFPEPETILECLSKPDVASKENDDGSQNDEKGNSSENQPTEGGFTEGGGKNGEDPSRSTYEEPPDSSAPVG